MLGGLKAPTVTWPSVSPTGLAASLTKRKGRTRRWPLLMRTLVWRGGRPSTSLTAPELPPKPRDASRALIDTGAQAFDT